MSYRALLLVIAIITTLPPDVNLWLFPFETLEGLVLRIIYGPSAPPPEILFKNPKINMTTDDLVEYYGYPFEKHIVTTADGYILELHRIPNKKSISSQNQIILLVPGLMSDSGFFLYNGRKSPALLFHDAEHDVWLQNNRGTRYSRKHKTLAPDRDKEFWNYSFHEMGIYDLPASVDYILNVTRSKQLFMLGHSMGGTATTILLAEKPEFQNKVMGAFLLAPAIKLEWSYLIVAMKYLQWLIKLLLLVMNEGEILPYNENFMLLVSHLCSGKVFSKLCALSTFFGMFSYTFLTLDYAKGEGSLAMMGARLSGTNVKVLLHYLQMAVNADFSQYDYGSKINMVVYGQRRPPEYNLSTINVPVSLFQSEGDMLINVQDTIDASHRFKNLITMTIIRDKWFSHLDYMFVDSAVNLVFNKIINQMAVIDYNGEPKSWGNLQDQQHNTYFMIMFAFVMLVVGSFVISFLHLLKLGKHS